MQSTNLAPGTTVGGEYVIERKLASGGMGLVYIARQLSTHKLRALKMLPSLEGADAKARDQFVREAKVGGRINSEYIVEVVGAGIDADLGHFPWIAMELLEGSDLSEFAEGKAIAPEHAVMILQQLFSAVIAAHQADVVHRDLRPDNVFLNKSALPGMPFMVKVLDFGIAKLVDSTKTGSIGTPGWLAPEQFKSNEVGKTADVWALGLLTFFTLTGRRFWLTEYQDNVPVHALQVEKLMEAIPAASARAARYGCGHRLPAGFDDWFAKCLNRDASGRFPDAEVAWQALMPLLSVGSAPASVRGTVASSPALQYMQFHTQPQAPNPASVVTAPTEFNTHQGVVKGRTVSSTALHWGTTEMQAALSSKAKGRSSMLAAFAAGSVMVAGVAGVGLWLLLKNTGEQHEQEIVWEGAAAALSSGLEEVQTAPTEQKDTGGTAGCPGGCGPLEQCGKVGNTSLCVAKSVAVPGGYSIDATPVTRSQYQAWLSTNPSTAGQPTACKSWNTTYQPDTKCMKGERVYRGSNSGNHPVVCVDWCDAYAYCKGVGKRLCGKIGGGANGWNNYANASTSQWYAACSSGGKYEYPYGDTFDGQACNGDTKGLGTTSEVGSFSGCQSSASGYEGVYDMSGNVWEWEDSCNGNTGKSDNCRVRGGSFFGFRSGILDRMRCGNDYVSARDFSVNTGFRCCSP